MQNGTAKHEMKGDLVGVRLRTAGGSWRPAARSKVQRRRLAAFERFGGWRWAAWAGRLAERYAADRVSRGWLGRTLRLASPGAAPGRSRAPTRGRPVLSPASWQLNLTLRLITPVACGAIDGRSEQGWRTPTVHRSERLVLARAATLETRTVVRTSRELAEGVVSRLRRRETTIAEWESALVERILTGYRRRESSTGPAAPWLGVMPPVSRVFSRPAPTSAAPADWSASQAFQPSAPTYWDGTPPAAAPVDVEQLTNQVIRSLDQRVTAARERRTFGKA